MKQVRFGAFETNSSSTHCLTVVTAEDFQRWREDELWFDAYNQFLYKKDEFDDGDEDAVSFEYANDWCDLDYEFVKLDHKEYVAISLTIDNH